MNNALALLKELDVFIFQFVNQKMSNTFFDSFFPAITDLHKNYFFTGAVLIFFFYLFQKNNSKKKALTALLFLILSFAFSDGTGSLFFKKTFQRPRPPDTVEAHAIVRSSYGGYSFISNHASNNFNIAYYVSALFPPAAPYIYTVATLVAFSRVYNGVHFPFDVIFGGLYGTLCGWIFVQLYKKLINYRKEYFQ